MLNQETITIRVAGQTVEVRAYGRDAYWVEALIRALESPVADAVARIGRAHLEARLVETATARPSGCAGCPD